ncbi:MAG: hypothetical protein M1825_002398 [Sarcosagium campestre]|nr:MAG: hypothetical protein M1825_002398 [Sarcosagium campestre]
MDDSEADDTAGEFPFLDDASASSSLAANFASSTLLPSPIASLVSLATKSSSVSLQIGTFIGGLAINGAKVTTLTGIELSRSMIEGILAGAGREVVGRSTGELGKEEAEGLLERSIATLHNTLTHASFLVATGFHLSAASLSSASTLSLHVLSALDAVLGSTESSRAIASIITLIRREFKNPETGVKGERVGVADLLVGLCGLALLQRWCWKQTERAVRDQRGEEVVWDVVLLDNGSKTASIGSQIEEDSDDASGRRVTSSPTHAEPITREAVNYFDSRVSNDPQRVAETLRHRLLQQLPASANVSITTESVTTDTITVEISGAKPSSIAPPPGMTLVDDEEISNHKLKRGHADVPSYRVVYQTTRNKLRSTSIEGEEQLEVADIGAVQKQLPQIPTDEGSSSTDSLTLQGSPVRLPRIENADRPRQRLSKPQPSVDRPAPGVFSDDDSDSYSRIPVRRSPPSSGHRKPSGHKNTSGPPSSASASDGSDKPGVLKRKLSLPKVAPKGKPSANDKVEKKGALRRALKKRTSNTTLSSLWNTNGSNTTVVQTERTKDQRPPWGSNIGVPVTKPQRTSPVPARNPPTQQAGKEQPRAPQRGNPNFFSSRDLGQIQEVRSPSRTSYYSIHERRRDSIVSTTDTYSLRSAEVARPGSPAQLRTHSRASNTFALADSSVGATMTDASSAAQARSRLQASKSYAPSIYTLKSNNSETSLVLASLPRRSVLDDQAAILHLHRSGIMDGAFPRAHLIQNITRFVRFSSAAYGSHFLRIMGISSMPGQHLLEGDATHHHEHHSFSRHTRLPASTILLSSFVDPQGGSNAAGETDTGVPLVHYVTLDHESKAVVLTCRGTLGFEDVLTDMTCDYDEMRWRGKSYRVHKGIHASARRLLDGGGGRVMATIKAALEEFPEYGFVLCGHSLGGGVASVLAILLSEPDAGDAPKSAFVTSSKMAFRTPLLLTSGSGSDVGGAPQAPIVLPAERPIHVYAYGPPATVSPSLRVATRGLITTVVNGQDIVPTLSLGILRDMQAVALAFKTDTSNAKGEVRRRVWEGLKAGLGERVYGESQAAGVSSTRGCDVGDEGDDQWALSALKSLRASMLSDKLGPPGEVFIVETQPVLQRNAFTPGVSISADGAADVGRPATRAVLKYVRDVEGRFGELRFGASMLGDHSPGRYEASLSALEKGVLGE